jgi:hypothetical protein
VTDDDDDGDDGDDGKSDNHDGDCACFFNYYISYVLHCIS